MMKRKLELDADIRGVERQLRVAQPVALGAGGNAARTLQPDLLPRTACGPRSRRP